MLPVQPSLFLGLRAFLIKILFGELFAGFNATMHLIVKRVKQVCITNSFFNHTLLRNIKVLILLSVNYLLSKIHGLGGGDGNCLAFESVLAQQLGGAILAKYFDGFVFRCLTH